MKGEFPMHMYFEMIYIMSNCLNSLLQYHYDPQQFGPKLFMIIMITILTLKSFKYLNIFDDFSPLVSMLAQVIFDLKEFLFVYFIFLINFSLVITTLQNEAGIDYIYIGMFIGNFVDTMKLSMGDFGVIERVQVDLPHKTIFWISWGFIVLIMSIIFLNFIIAEASASYERVNELLVMVIQKDKVGLINEAEKMIPR